MTMEAAHAVTRAVTAADWADRIRTELTGNILPFWLRHVLDRAHGGFFGEVGSDLDVRKDAPRSCVLNTRILWTYAAAARQLGPEWLAPAEWAFDYICAKFWDREQSGLYWLVDGTGAPLDLHKQTYAQAFGIYAFSEYYRATGDEEALELAQKLYALIEAHAFDPQAGGYFEARGRAWEELEDVRLSAKDLNSPKSMNTHLHVLEGYTNLLRVWPDEGLRAQQKRLLDILMDHIVDTKTGHFRLFFDQNWNTLSDHVSFGHDIEGSWLLYEAAQVLGDPILLKRAREIAVHMAEVSLTEALDHDGSLLYEADGAGFVTDAKKHWWVQAEAVIGFYNAYELTGKAVFREAALRSWAYIEDHVVDRVHGEWHAKLSREGVVLAEAEDSDAVLAGPWKCPYHNARVCYELLNRLGRSENNTP